MPNPSSAHALLKDRPLLIFLVCAVMFHFANAAMLPLLGEMLAKGQGRSSMMFMSACVVTTQLVITLLASWSGRKAGAWGRKPLLLMAFGVLPVRAVLYTLTANTGALVAIQILDGVGAGIFGVVSVLVIADLTQGHGPLQSHPRGHQHGGRHWRFAQPGHRRFHRASLWFQRGLSLPCRGRVGRIRHPLLLHAGDTR